MLKFCQESQMRNTMKSIMKITGLTLTIMVITIMIWHSDQGQPLAKPSDFPVSFTGNLLAASDADMVATAYADGKLDRIKSIQDTLSVIAINDGIPIVNSRQFVSNSVISWPSIIAWNKAHQLAYVAETRGVFTDDRQEVKDVFQDFPHGKVISVIDYSDQLNPKVVQQTPVGENIQGVSINHDASLLVAGSTEQGREIIVAELENGLIKQRHYFTSDEIKPVHTNNSGIRTIEFHPSENIIAANLNNTRLVFYRIAKGRNGLDLQPVGKSIQVAKNWSVGNWHPNGKHFILTDVAWGKGALGAIFNGKGSLVSVEMNPNGNHEIVSKTKVGLSPEGFDLSPDGQYAIVANMRRTYGPTAFWFVPARKNASLSLVKIDGTSGKLETLGKPYGFEGALPEDAIFDKESNSIAVAVYHQQDLASPTQGWIDFWELENDQLIYTGQKAHVTRGVHNLLLID